MAQFSYLYLFITCILRFVTKKQGSINMNKQSKCQQVAHCIVVTVPHVLITVFSWFL